MEMTDEFSLESSEPRVSQAAQLTFLAGWFFVGGAAECLVSCLAISMASAH